MTPHFDPVTSTLRLAFEDRGEAKAFFAESVREGVFVVVLAARPGDFAILQIHARDAGSFDFACEARAVQIFHEGRSWRVVVQLAGWNAAAEANLQRRLVHFPSSSPGRNG